MKKFVVGVINFFDNALVMEVVEASDWRSALLSHTAFSVYKEDYAESFKGSLKDAKNEAFNMDMMIDVIEL